MQFARNRRAVLAGGEHHEVFAGIQRPRREWPQPRNRRIVAQRPVRQIGRLRAAVVDFDPSLKRAIFISQPVGGDIVAEDFVDHQIGGREVRVQCVIPVAAGEGIRRRSGIRDSM